MLMNMLLSRIAARLSAFALLLTAFAVCLMPGVAFADLPDPETLELEEVECFRHMLEANDMLVLARYECTYANDTVQPDHPIADTFNFRLYDSNTTSVSNTTAYAFHHNGYDKGIVSFYLAANRTLMDWGDLGNITIIGSSLFDSPAPNTTYEMVAADYTSSTSPATIREELRQFIISQATFLQLDWNQYWLGLGAESMQIELLTFVTPDYTVLSYAGESYFTNAIENLRSMCPLLFANQLIVPSYEDANWTSAQAGNYESQWSGTNVSTFMTAASDFFGGIPFQVIGTIGSVFFILGTMVFCAVKGYRIAPAIVIAFPAILIFTRMGWTEMALVWLGTAVCVLLLARAWFLRESQG